MAAFPMHAPSMSALRQAPVYFRYGSNKDRLLVDAFTAGAIVAVYDAVNAGKKAEIEGMVSGTRSQMLRMAAFCMSKMK